MLHEIDATGFPFKLNIAKMNTNRWKGGMHSHYVYSSHSHPFELLEGLKERTEALFANAGIQNTGFGRSAYNKRRCNKYRG